jgi:hypothetical protein
MLTDFTRAMCTRVQLRESSMGVVRSHGPASPTLATAGRTSPFLWTGLDSAEIQPRYNGTIGLLVSP